MPFQTIDDIKRANAAAGLLFFDPPALRFFKSRILSEVFPTTDGAYFVTSERMNEAEPRLYSVRFAAEDGRVHRRSAFRRYETAKEARAEAKRLQGIASA